MGIRLNEIPLFSCPWLDNGEETRSSTASVDALQTASLVLIVPFATTWWIQGVGEVERGQEASR
jgi:hypothetical protein